MRKNVYFLFILLVTVFSSCKQYKNSLEEYLSYWASEAYITHDDSSARAAAADTEGFYCVSSATDAVITLKLHNPKDFSLVMPSVSETRKIVGFPQLTGGEPKVFDDYELIQPEKNILKLTLKKNFLEKHEWGETDISPSFTLYAADGRKFNRAHTVKLKANTPPPAMRYALCQSDDGNFVICIKVPMENLSDGRLLHNDINAIAVNGEKHPLKVNEYMPDFELPAGGSFIAKNNVVKIKNPPAGFTADEVPVTGGGVWVLYYKTDVQAPTGAGGIGGGASKDYAIKLLDNKGLSSPELKISTALNKPLPLKLSYNGDEITGNAADSPYIIPYTGSISEILLKAKTDTAGVKVIQKTEKKSGGVWIEVKTETGAGNELDIRLAAEDGAEYRITLNTGVTAEFAAADEAVRYLKLIQNNGIPNFKITDGVSAADMPYTSDTPFNAAGNAGTDSSNPIVIYKRTGNAKLRLNGAAAGETMGYTLSVGTMKVIDAPDTYNQTADVELESGKAYALTAWINKNGTKGAPYTLYFTVKNALTEYKELKNTVKNITGGSNAIIKVENLTCAAADSPQITVEKKITVEGTDGNKTLDANRTSHHSEGRIFYVKTGGKLTLKNLTLTGGNIGHYDHGNHLASSGGALFIEGGEVILDNIEINGCKALTTGGTKGMGGGVYLKAGSLTIQNDTIIQNCVATNSGSAVYAAGGSLLLDSAVIKNNKLKDDPPIPPTPDSGAINVTAGATITLKGDPRITGGNNIFLADNGGSVTIEGPLTAAVDSIGIELTGFTEGREVLTGALAGNTDKFKLEGPSASWWTIGTDGKLQKKPRPVNGYAELQKAVRDAPDGAVIEVKTDLSYDENISGVPGGFASSTIEVTKNITVQSADSAKKTLSLGTGTGTKDHIFSLKQGKKLILKNLTLRGSEKSAISVDAENGELELNKVRIESCTTEEETGAAIDFKGKTLTLKGSEINGCESLGGTDTMAGIRIAGISNDKRAVVKMDRVIIQSCKSIRTGGIYAEQFADCTLSGVKIDDCESTHGMGGGLFVGETVTVRMQKNDDGNGSIGCIISNCKALVGGGVYVEGGTFEIDAGTVITKCNTEHNTDGNGGGVYVKNGTFTMNNGMIKGNTAKKLGGGVYLEGGSFEIKNGTIGDVGTDDKNTATDGGGVYVKDGTFTMTGGTIQKNTATQSGGGVYMEKGSFTMSGGKIESNSVTIDSTDNDITKGGGGVCIKAKGRDTAAFTLTGGSINGNTAGAGAGVFIFMHGKFDMNGGTITGNDSSKAGGGVCMSSIVISNRPATLSCNMTSGTIINNTATETGGGVYAWDFHNKKGTIVIKGSSKILGNTANESGAMAGGGIYSQYKLTVEGNAEISGNRAPNGFGGGIASSKNFDFKGGTISGNTAAHGGGVYINNGPFTMSGDAQVTPSAGGEANTTGKNDVYLANNQTITVNGALTANPAARITPAFYISSVPVLDGAIGVTGTPPPNYIRFKVTPKSPDNWYVGSDGKLTMTNPMP